MTIFLSSKTLMIHTKNGNGMVLEKCKCHNGTFMELCLTYILYLSTKISNTEVLANAL
jgi:hypothetical protein